MRREREKERIDFVVRVVSQLEKGPSEKSSFSQRSLAPKEDRERERKQLSKVKW